MMLHCRHLIRCFSSYGRVSQHLPGGADMYSQHRRCQVAQPCVSPSPISRGGDCLRACIYCLHTRHFLITQKAPLRHDATLPTPALMFLVLRTCFTTSAWGGQICIHNIVDAKLLNRASLHRLFRVGATVYVPAFTVYMQDIS